MNKSVFGNTDIFAIECRMFKNEGSTEIAMYVNGKNILAFNKDGEIRTTLWNLDNLVEWLKNFIDNMKEDPYPVECEGTYAAIKDIKAREFDSDNDDLFDAYYDKLDAWNESHRWHTSSNGAVLADVYFQLKGDNIEISWNNQDRKENFLEVIGGASIPKEIFESVINAFLKFYAGYWVSLERNDCFDD